MSLNGLQVQQTDPFFDPLREVREAVTQRLTSERAQAIDRAHIVIESTERSPYLTDFEDFYRRKLALGKITLGEVFAKIDAAVLNRGITVTEAEHMKEHLLEVPPSVEDIQAAIQEEIDKQYREAEKRINDALAEQQRVSLELALIQQRREDRRRVRVERRSTEAKTILENRSITKHGRTLSFGKNGQLYVFRKGQRGRSKMTTYYRKLQRLLRGMREAAEQTQGENQ